MKELIKEIIDVNQISKGFNSESTYIIRNGEILSHSFSNKKNSCYIRMRRKDGEPIISRDMTVGIIGQTLYEYIKNTKKSNIESVITDNDTMTIVSNTGDKFTAKFGKQSNKFFKEVKKGIKHFKKKDAKTIDITDKVIEALDNNLPVVIVDGNFRLRFSKKFIKIRYTDKISDVKLKYHPINDDLFIVNIEVEKDNYIIEHVFYSIRF